MPSGKLIALYGVNNLGKSTQADFLVKRLKEAGIRVRYVKYPLYDKEPTGPQIDSYLRGGNPLGLDPTSFQLLQVINRLQFDRQMLEMLTLGTWVVCEDYRGTGIAWGIGSGVDQDLLLDLNETLVAEDLCFLIDGERFLDSREKGHRHEENDALVEEVRQVHKELADWFGWKLVDANQHPDEVHEAIWHHVEKLLPK